MHVRDNLFDKKIIRNNKMQYKTYYNNNISIL